MNPYDTQTNKLKHIRFVDLLASIYLDVASVTSACTFYSVTNIFLLFEHLHNDESLK